MRPLQSAPILYREQEHWDFCQSSSCIRRHAWGLPYSASRGRSAIASPVALHVCILSCATAPRPGCCPRFCVPILPPQQRVVQRCLTRGTVISRPVVWGPIGLALPRSRSPCSPPWPFCYVSGAPPPSMSIDQSHQPGTASGAGRQSPPPSRPHRRSNSDHASKRYIFGWNREFQSQCAKLRMCSELSTNQLWKFHNRLYVFKTGYLFETG